MKEKGTKKRTGLIIGLVALALAAAGGITAFFLLRGPGADIQPTSQTAEGIAPDTAFLLRRGGGGEADELTASIVFSPAVGFTLAEEEGQAGLYRITPTALLEPGIELSITVGGGRPVKFTVQNRLMVQSMLPADGGRRVPLTSGIEFTFNAAGISMNSFKKAFSIDPLVPGNFTSAEGRYVFYPLEPLDAETTYTVGLSQALRSQSEAPLTEAVSLSFTTQAAGADASDRDRQFQMYGNGFSVNSLPGELPAFLAYIDQNVYDTALAAGAGEVAVTVRAFEKWEDYAEQLADNAGRDANAQSIMDTSGLATVSTFTLMPMAAQEGEDVYYGRGQWVLQFPETLPPGWYAVEFTLDTGSSTLTRNQFLQVSDLSVFTMTSGENLLCWVNDAATGRPVEGAQLTLEGGFNASVVTGADGTALAADGRAASSRLGGRFGDVLTVTHGDTAFVDINNYYLYKPYFSTAETARARSFISTLFCDRPIYRTTDSLQAWGVLRPRSGAAPAEDEEVRLVLADYGSTDMASAPVELRPDGTFTAELPFEGLSSSWAEIRLMVGEDLVASTSVTIEDYVKPIYTSTVTTDKPVYMVGADSEATLTLNVSMFDGTPAPDMTVALSLSGDDVQLTQQDEATDANGNFTATAALWDNTNTWYPRGAWYSFQSTNPQAENLYRSGNLYTIHRDVMLRGAMEPGSAGQVMKVSTHAIDTSRIISGEQVYDYDLLRGAALSQEVTAEVHKVYFTKNVTGTYYDFVNRRTAESYSYTKHDEVVGNHSFTTQNGEYRLEGLPASDNDACYYAVLRTTDSRGRTVESKAWLGSLYERYAHMNNTTTRYALMRVTGERDVTAVEGEDGLALYWRGTLFRDNEDVRFYLAQNEEAMAELPGRFLYTVVKDDFTHTAISEELQITLPFAEALLPNYTLAGAYFDGTHIFPLENTPMVFSAEDRALDITLTPDSDSYAPGDEVKVAAQVSVAATGQPAADTALVLAVVDEAIFALRGQSTDTLNSLYRQMAYPEVRKYASYTQLFTAPVGEMGGGGGGDEARSDFKDTAQFATATTDGGGKASFKFKLPDNITKWRLTACGVDENNFAGNGLGSVIATKPFFVSPIVNESLLEGDDVAVGLYGAGVAVAGGDETQYTVTLKGEGVDMSQTAASALRSYASVNFGPVPQGEYTVTVAGSCGGYEDAVQLLLTVAATGVEVSVVESFDLANGLDVEPLRWPVSVSFYGAGGRTTGRVLQALQVGGQGTRADMRLARTYAARLMAQQDGWYSTDDLEQDLSDIDGRSVLTLFPYAQQDVALSVKARLAAPQLVGDGFLSALFSGNVYYYDAPASVMVLARALAGEPLGTDLQAMMDGPGMSRVDRIYIAMAMALSGDEAGARAAYAKEVEGHLMETFGVSGARLLAVEGDGAQSDEATTAAASMLATLLKTPEAEGLILQLTEKGSEYEPHLLEQMYYLTTFGPGTGSGGSFTYQLNGKTVTQKLEGEVVTLSFSREQFEAANFAVAEGPVYADVYYTASPASLPAADVSIGLEKTVVPVQGEGGPGTLYKVTLTPSFPGLDTSFGDRLLVLEDHIPSGLRFERYAADDSYYGAGSRGWSLSDRQGQRVEFTMYGTLTEFGGQSITYYARAATPGRYVVENAYISSATGSARGASARSQLDVEDAG